MLSLPLSLALLVESVMRCSGCVHGTTSLAITMHEGCWRQEEDFFSLDWFSWRCHLELLWEVSSPPASMLGLVFFHSLWVRLLSDWLCRWNDGCPSLVKVRIAQHIPWTNEHIVCYWWALKIFSSIQVPVVSFIHSSSSLRGIERTWPAFGGGEDRRMLLLWTCNFLECQECPVGADVSMLC